MGDKIESKRLARLMRRADAPGLEARSATSAGARQAQRIGYPVLLKASSRRRRQGHAQRDPDACRDG
ncbi:MAG: hypothetical protein R2736_23375 [Solirubrobacterales bacterium]